MTPLILTCPSQCLGPSKIFIVDVIHFPSSIFPLQLIKWQKPECLQMMQESGHGIRVLPSIDNQNIRCYRQTFPPFVGMFFWEPVPWTTFCSMHYLNKTASFPTCSGDSMVLMSQNRKAGKTEQIEKGRRKHKCLNSLPYLLCFSILPIGSCSRHYSLLP